MIVFPYTSTITIDPSSVGAKFALVHPGGSQIGSLLFRGLDLPKAAVGTVRFQIHRHPSKATDGSTGAAYSVADNAPASFAEVRHGNVTWPADPHTFESFAFADPRGLGGGVVVPTANIASGALIVAADHSLVFESLDPDTRGDIDVRLFWGEQRSSLPHIASAILPAASAFTEATHFPVPIGWTSITFAVTYTAHAGSTGARVAWRGSCSDGVNEYPLTTLDTTIDVQGQRLLFPMTDKWHTTIAGGATIRFTVSFDIPPGMPRVRLDLAEIGDTTNRGTAAAVVTGQ